MLILGAWYVNLLSILFCLVCVFMILVILIQRPRGGGLSGAFGGAGGGGSQAVFGAKTGDVLTWFTVVCFTAFLMLAMGLTWTIGYDHSSSIPVIQALQPAGSGSPQEGAATQTPAGGLGGQVDPGADPSQNQEADPAIDPAALSPATGELLSPHDPLSEVLNSDDPPEAEAPDTPNAPESAETQETTKTTETDQTVEVNSDTPDTPDTPDVPDIPAVEQEANP